MIRYPGLEMPLGNTVVNINNFSDRGSHCKSTKLGTIDHRSEVKKFDIHVMLAHCSK